MNNNTDRLLTIANAHRRINWCILANLLSFLIPHAFLIILPFQIYYIYKLEKGLEYGPPIQWCIGMFIPLISLIVLLILSRKAIRRLENEGFGVGLMGANLNEVRSKML